MIICARPQTEFLKHEFFRTPSFHKWKHFRIYILGLIGIKPKKMAFTSTIHFFVLFPLASEYEFDNSKVAFVDYFDFLSFGFLRKSVRTCVWRKWFGVSVVQVSWTVLNVAFQIRRIRKNCSKKQQQQQTCRVWVPRRSWWGQCRRRNLRSIPPRFRSSDH